MGTVDGLAEIRARLQARIESRSGTLERAEAYLARRHQGPEARVSDTVPLGPPAMGGAADPAVEVVAETEESAEPELSGWEWTGPLTRGAVMTPQDHQKCAREVEAGVIAASVTLAGGRFEDADRYELEAIAAAGQIAMDRMMVGNLRLVMQLARQHARGDANLAEDLFQEGVFGLQRAILGWDYRRGYSFSTYAVWHIRQRMQRIDFALRSVIDVPIHIQEDWAAYRRKNVQLSRLAVQARDLVSNRVPLEDVTDQDFDQRLDQSGGFDLLLDRLRDQYFVDDLVSFLSDRSLRIVRLRIRCREGEESTLQAIATMEGVTRERIRQLEAAAIWELSCQAVRLAYIRGFDGELGSDRDYRVLYNAILHTRLNKRATARKLGFTFDRLDADLAELLQAVWQFLYA